MKFRSLSFRSFGALADHTLDFGDGFAPDRTFLTNLMGVSLRMPSEHSNRKNDNWVDIHFLCV